MVYVGHRLNNTTLDPIRHLIVGFPIDFMCTQPSVIIFINDILVELRIQYNTIQFNCTIAVAGELQLIDKLHDPFTKTSGHLP